MIRPLLQRRTNELEALFEAEQSDQNILQMLEVELPFVPRRAL